MLKRLTQSGLVWLWVFVLLLLIDRVSKEWAITHLHLYQPLGVTPFFNLTLAYNTGAAFSFLNSASGWQQGMLGGLAIAVSVVILFWLYRLKRSDRWESIALCFILAGAIGNVLDRIYYHHVIDFLDFHIQQWHFAIFNVADSVICIGALMLLLRLVKLK